MQVYLLFNTLTVDGELRIPIVYIIYYYCYIFFYITITKSLTERDIRFLIFTNLKCLRVANI